MTFPITPSITGDGSYFRVQPIGWTVFQTWDYCWGQANANSWAKPPGSYYPYNAYYSGPLQCGMRRVILFFDTTGITGDLVLRLYVTTGGWGPNQLCILNGNGADPDFGSEIFGWMRGRFSPEYLIATRDLTTLTQYTYQYFLIPAAHVNSSGYTVLILAHSSDYGHLGADPGAVNFTVGGTGLVLSPAGFIWIEGTKIAYVDGAYTKRTQEGTLDGASGKVAGHAWIGATKLRYIDSSGNERYIEGVLTGLSGKIASQISINTNPAIGGTKFCYIDSSGNERCFQGTAA